MKYIQNNGRYALSFEITKNNKAAKVVLDRKRVFLDTGNIATTGITEVSDEDYDKLCEYKRFNALMEEGELELTEATKIETAETKVKALEEANKKLEDELKKAKDKQVDKDVKKQLGDKDKEINALKAKLESLSNKKGKTADKEVEGF